MLKLYLFVILFLPVTVACAQNVPPMDCPYSRQVVTNLEAPEGGSVVSEKSHIDTDSKEKVNTHSIEFDDGNVAVVKQKYCSMYNFEASYKMKSLDRESFQQGLKAIQELVDNVQQDYQLKAPLASIIDMTMNQKKLSLNSKFSYGLPAQAARSSEYVEHSISFTPLAEDDPFDAEIQFYFGLGGD